MNELISEYIVHVGGAAPRMLMKKWR